MREEAFDALTPLQQYYARASGSWRGVFTVSITSWRGFWEDAAPLQQRMALLSLVGMERVLGPTPLRTRVQLTDDPQRIEHLAELSRFGVVLYRARRRFLLDADGCAGVVEGEEASWPWSGRAVSLPPGEVRPLGDGAAYRMPMCGVMWDIVFEVGEHAGRSVVSCAWARGEERLERAALGLLT